MTMCDIISGTQDLSFFHNGWRKYLIEIGTAGILLLLFLLQEFIFYNLCLSKSILPLSSLIPINEEIDVIR
jgi:hypothetical protein